VDPLATVLRSANNSLAPDKRHTGVLDQVGQFFIFASEIPQVVSQIADIHVDGEEDW
jgi:hypothetical protein